MLRLCTTSKPLYRISSGSCDQPVKAACNVLLQRIAKSREEKNHCQMQSKKLFLEKGTIANI